MVQIDIPATPEDPAEAKQYEMKVATPGTVVEWEIGKHQYASVAEYIETLERAVLKSWRELDEVEGWACHHCSTNFVLDYRDFVHNPDCSVLALLEKYAE